MERTGDQRRGEEMGRVAKKTKGETEKEERREKGCHISIQSEKYHP